MVCASCCFNVALAADASSEAVSNIVQQTTPVYNLTCTEGVSVDNTVKKVQLNVTVANYDYSAYRIYKEKSDKSFQALGDRSYNANYSTNVSLEEGVNVFYVFKNVNDRKVGDPVASLAVTRKPCPTASVVISANATQTESGYYTYCGTGAALTSDNAPVLTYNFTPADAEVTPTGFTLPTPPDPTKNIKLTNVTNGEHTYMLVATYGGCTVSSTAVLSVANYTHNTHETLHICKDNSVTMNATQPTGFTGVWNGYNAEGSTNPTVTINNPDGDYFWTAKHTNGCEFKETWTVVNDRPNLNVTVSQASDCGSTTLTATSKTDPTWTIKRNGAAYSSAGHLSADKRELVLTESGNYSVTVEATGTNSCKQTVSRSVTVNSLDGFDDSEVPLTTCKDNSISINAPSVSGASSQLWTIDGTGTISPNRSSSSINVTGLAEGETATLVWTVMKDNCSVSKKYTIYNGTVTATGSDVLLCRGETTTTIGLSYSGSKDIEWTPSGKIDASSCSSTANSICKAKGKEIKVTNLSPGSNVFTASVKNSNDENACEAVPITVTVYSVQLEATATPSSVCSSTQDITLHGSDPSKYPGGVGYWTAVGGTVNNKDASVTTARVTGSGAAEFTWHVDVTVPGANGSDDLTCTSTKSVAVNRDNNDIPTEIEICTDDGTATLSVPATGVKSTTGKHFNMTNNAAGIITESENSVLEATVSGLSTGVTTIVWTGKSNKDCPLTTNFKIYNVKMSSNPTASTPRSGKFVCTEEDQVTLDATQCGNLPGYWTYDGAGINTQTNSTSQTNVVTLKPSETSAATTMYWNVKYTTAKGDECTAKAGVTVENLYVDPNPGVDDEICNYEDNQPKTNWNTYTMKAAPLPTTSPATTGKWTTTTSGVIIEESEATKHDAKINNLASGINVFTWTVTRQTSDGSGICKRSRDVTIYNSAVSKAETSADIYTCEDFTNDLSATKAMDGTGAWTLQSGHGYFNKSSADDTPIGTHEVYETQQITYAEAPYKNQKFIIRADVYNYDYNETQDIVYTYYLLTGSERSVFTDGTASAKMLTSAGDFTASESNRISSENLYDKTYTLNPKVVRLQAGKNTFRWEVSKNQLPGGNGCSNYKDVNVYYLPVQVEAGDPQFLCTNYGALQGSMSEVTFTNIEDIVWKKEWTTSSGAVIDDKENLYSPVTNLAPTKNKFTLHAIVYHKDQLICDASDDVIIWNDDVGDVNAGQDDVDCGTVTNGGKLDGSYQSYIGDYHSLSADMYTTLRNGIGVSGEWSVIGGGVDQIVFGDRYSNVTSVTGLQRYMQDCTEGYWSQQGVSNQFRWTVTYTNPETGHTCSNYDDVQITWLAPGDPDAGEDQLVCSDYVDLAPGDQGCGAEKTWWAFPGSAANENMNVDVSKWSNPYWGGNSYLVADERDLVLGNEEKAKMKAAYGLSLDAWNKKDRLVYTDVSYLDGRYYRIQSVRQTYKNSTGSIIYVDVSYAAYECEADGKVAGKDVKQEILDTDNATAVNPENYGKQLSLYQIADEVSNVAIYAQPTPSDKDKRNTVNFRWYKNNQLYSPKKGYVVSCTSWDEVPIQFLGGMMDLFAGNEQVVCAENEIVHLDATDNGTTFDGAGKENYTYKGETRNVPVSNKNPNYKVALWENAWDVVEGAGTFTNKSSKSTIVTNLGMGTNIYRWTTTLIVEGKTGTTDFRPQKCTSTDDVYVTNASPSQAAVGDDREECNEITSISANLPVRSTGSFWVSESGSAYITKQEIKDQQVSAYVTNMHPGVNTFTFHVLNYYESPKNPEVAKVCESTASISLYYHKLPADAGFDQFLCVDEVNLKGNDLSITFKDEAHTIIDQCSFAEAGAFGELDKNAQGQFVRLPHGKWYQAMTNDQYFYDANDPNSEASVGSTSVSNVIVKPLSHDFNKFHWQVTWGNCVSDDEVDVYVNMPTPTPNAGSDRATCDDEIDLGANNSNNKGRQEWTSLDENGVTLAPADEMSCHVSGLRSGLDNTFYWTFYREKLEQYPGMLPSQLAEYLAQVKKYTQDSKKYLEYAGYLEYYNSRLETYKAEMDAFNEYVDKLKEYVNYVNCKGNKLKISLGYTGIADPGDCEALYTQKTKPADVQMPAHLQEPPKVAEPVDTSASNSEAPWAGLGLWNYYVKLSQDAAKANPSKYEKVYPRQGEEVLQGEKLREKDGMYYVECYMADDVVIHSNSINVKASDYAACDYHVIRGDGPYTETSNNVFMTCVNKMDTVNAHPYGMRTHQLEVTSVGFSPAVIPDRLEGNFTGMKGTENSERQALRTSLQSASTDIFGKVDYSNYAVLWTQMGGPKELTIKDAATMHPSVSDAVDGTYPFQVYAVRMNGPNSFCESVQNVTVDIHIPTMAALEVRYQGIGDWTLDRTAMCQDHTDMQWMSATGITYTPSSQLEEGSTLEPGGIKEVPINTEYSIFRVANDDTGGNNITFSKNSYTDGTPGLSEYKVSGLPYNGTSFELLNCINYIDRNKKMQVCKTSDTIIVFNNSVYADADVRIDPDKSQAYEWAKQEVNICGDTYELKANDPQGFRGNKEIVQYETYGLWGFDDKDFKGYVFGRPQPQISDNSTYFNATVSNLWPSDNHQRANGLIWCVYKSILPPDCKLINRKTIDWTGGSEKWYPLRFLCAHGTTYRDYYNSDGSGHIYFYYAEEDPSKNNRLEPNLEGERFFQIKFVDPDDNKVKYSFIKVGYNYQTVQCATDGTTLQVNLVEDEYDAGLSFCITEESIKDYVPENGKILMPYDKLQHRTWNQGCFANDAVSTYTGNDRCVAYYSIEDIENSDADIAQRMRVQNFLYYMRNSCGNTGTGRTKWNYYATFMDDDPNYMYLWSDRETHGGTYGYITYECENGAKGQLGLIGGGNPLSSSTDFSTYFKGAIALIPTESEKKWLKDNFTISARANNQSTKCWPTQFDGGGNNNPPTGWKGGGFNNGAAFDPTNANPEVWANTKECVSRDDHDNGKCGSSCGLCGFGGNINFFTWALWGYGQPGAIPTEVLVHTKDDDFGVFLNHLDPNKVPSFVHVTHSERNPIRSTKGENAIDARYTNFSALKGTNSIQDSNNRKLKNDVPVMPGWDYAYHVVNIMFDNEAFARYMDKLNSDIARQGVKERDPIVAKAQTVDELKEEADNADKHYWCVARDTVFIYDNTITSMEYMPSFVVCGDQALLKGEEPGGAAGANASGYWTIDVNKESVKYVEGYTSTDFVTKVEGLPAADETQFTWHIKRWNCPFEASVFVYSNAVESDAGKDIYVCEDKAQLNAVQPSVGVGYWSLTESSNSKTKFGDATGPLPDDSDPDPKKNSQAWVHNLKQGDNPFDWTVENPMPPTEMITDYDTEGNATGEHEGLGQINGHDYDEQEKCPVTSQTIVHDLRPDDAVINTGKEIPAPTPSPHP